MLPRNLNLCDRLGKYHIDNRQLSRSCRYCKTFDTSTLTHFYINRSHPIKQKKRVFFCSVDNYSHPDMCQFFICIFTFLLPELKIFGTGFSIRKSLWISTLFLEKNVTWSIQMNTHQFLSQKLFLMKHLSLFASDLTHCWWTHDEIKFREKQTACVVRALDHCSRLQIDTIHFFLFSLSRW